MQTFILRWPEPNDFNHERMTVLLRVDTKGGVERLGRGDRHVAGGLPGDGGDHRGRLRAVPRRSGSRDVAGVLDRR